MKISDLILPGALIVGGLFLYQKLFPDAQAAAYDAGQAAGQATADMIGGATEAIFGPSPVPAQISCLEASGKYGFPLSECGYGPSAGPTALRNTTIGSGSEVVIGTAFNPTFSGGITVTPKTSVQATPRPGNAPFAYNAGAAMQAFMQANAGSRAVSQPSRTASGVRAPSPVQIAGKKVVVGSTFNPTYAGGISLA